MLILYYILSNDILSNGGLCDSLFCQSLLVAPPDEMIISNLARPIEGA
jgi:hypothetical protein